MIAYLLFMAAAASTPAATAGAPPAQDPPKKEKMICKTDNFVGSRVSRRICKTDAVWRAGREGAQDTLNAIGRGGNYQNPTGPK